MWETLIHNHGLILNREALVRGLLLLAFLHFILIDETIELFRYEMMCESFPFWFLFLLFRIIDSSIPQYLIGTFLFERLPQKFAIRYLGVSTASDSGFSI